MYFVLTSCSDEAKQALIKPRPTEITQSIWYVLHFSGHLVVFPGFSFKHEKTAKSFTMINNKSIFPCHLIAKILLQCSLSLHGINWRFFVQIYSLLFEHSRNFTPAYFVWWRNNAWSHGNRFFCLFQDTRIPQVLITSTWSLNPTLPIILYSISNSAVILHAHGVKYLKCAKNTTQFKER